MKLSKLSLVVLAIILAGSISVVAQTAPNFENGFKPWGSYDGSHLDTVNLMNGNVMLHAPVVPNIPQRGALGLSNTLYASSKDWQVVCVPNSGGQRCDWEKGGRRDHHPTVTRPECPSHHPQVGLFLWDKFHRL